MTEIHRPGTGAIFGIVTEDGVVKSGSPVYLYDARRWAGIAQKRLLGVQLTQPDGGFVFNGLNPAYKDYVLSATDEDGVEPKNALIQDRVQPIPAHQGATWFTNWWVEALSDGAFGVVAAYPVMGDMTRWYVGGLVSEVENRSQSADPTLSSLTPGALQMAGVQLTGGQLVTPGMQLTNSSVEDYQLSLEWVIDLDSITSGTPACFWGSFANPVTHSNGMVRIPILDSIHGGDRWGSWLALRVSEGHLQAYVRASSNTNSGFTLALSQLFSFDLSGHSGVIHAAVVYRYGSRCDLFINGVSVALTISPPSIGQQWSSGVQRPFACILGGWETNGTGATYKTGPVAMYARALEDEEVLAHYEALMTEDVLPNRSGYQRAVMSLHPQIYFRLNEAVMDGENHAWPLLNPDKAGHLDMRAGKLVTQADGAVSPAVSPVVGDNAMAFTGADRLRCDAGMWMHASPDEASFSCWVKFDQATPSSVETLVRQNMPNSTTYYFLVQRDTDGYLRVATRRGGTNYTDTFTTYAPPVDTWLQVFIRVDLSDVADPYMELWVGTEVAAPELKERLGVGIGKLYSPATDLYSNNDNTTWYSRLEIAENLVGSLCEVAIYAQKITEGDMLAIWQAKDTV